MFTGHSFPEGTIAWQTGQTNEFIHVFIGEGAEGTTMDMCPLRIVGHLFGIFVLVDFHFISHVPIEQGVFPIAVIDLHQGTADRVRHDHIRKTKFDDS